MAGLLDLFASYSLPALALAALVAGALYVIRAAADRSIAQAFDRRARQMTLALERRSRFEETILIERYQTVSAYLIRLAEIAADINRHRAGQTVEGLIRDTEIAPLTALMGEIAARRHVLTGRFHAPLDRLAKGLLDLANAATAEQAAGYARDFARGRDALQDDIAVAFGLETIAGPDRSGTGVG